MGYPDLAIGDTWKSTILIERQILVVHKVRAKIGDSEAGKKIAVLMKDQETAYDKLISLLTILEDHRAVLDICDDGTKKYGANLESFFRAHKVSATERLHQRLEGSKTRHNEFDEASRKVYGRNFSVEAVREWEISFNNGMIMFLAYPFTPSKYLSRQEDVVTSAQVLFRNASSKCKLSYSSVRMGNTSSDILGVFATCDIASSEQLLEDSTIFAASTFSASAPSTLATRWFEGFKLAVCDNCFGGIFSDMAVSPDCCKTEYCSKHCQDTALFNYHKVLCGKNFEWLYEESRKLPKTVSLNGPLWLRILATCVQSGLHPLDHPAIARLAPLYSRNGRRWSFVNNIRHPILILQQLGINPFNDFRYETWVLHTIWARIVNNQEEHLEPVLEGGNFSLRCINPMYSFFNHSCEENAAWDVGGNSKGPSSCFGGSTKVLYAERPIKKGEEICVSYGTFTSSETKAERFALLASWIGIEGECGCPKCRRET